MPGYCSDGLLQISETENKNEKLIRALFTIDRAIGELKDGTMNLAFLRHTLDLATYNTVIKGAQFTIDVGQLYSPMKYYFSYNDDCQDYSLEFLSVEKDISNIKYLESTFK